MRDDTANNYKLGDILASLAKKYLQVKLFVGYKDSINNYGWHISYYVEVFRTVEYCSKCLENHSVNYKDDYYPSHHQHSHRTKMDTILSKEFMSEEKMIFELSNLI